MVWYVGDGPTLPLRLTPRPDSRTGKTRKSPSMIVDPKGWRLQCSTHKPTGENANPRPRLSTATVEAFETRSTADTYTTIPKSTSHGPEHKTPVVKRDRGHPMSRHMDGKDRLDGRLMSVISGPFRNCPVRRPPRLIVLLQVMAHGCAR